MPALGWACGPGIRSSKSPRRCAGWATAWWESCPVGLENDVRVTDAKEVGVRNPAEETFCHPNAQIMEERDEPVKWGPPLWGPLLRVWTF
jgi:hypothetical protein